MLNNDLDKAKLLISVKNEHEVNLVKDYADIIDLKNSEDGPLGSLNINDIEKIIKKFGDKFIYSATLGNMMEKSELKNKILCFDSLGLNYIKVGFFLNSQSKFNKFLECISQIKLKTKIVLVVFAENTDLIVEIKKNLNVLKEYRIQNLLIDTINKASSGLTEIYKYEFLRNLVLKAKNDHIKIGLAGKIELSHLYSLLYINPHVIGLRGAVCQSNERSKKILKKKVLRVYQLFKSHNNNAHAVAGA